uniref:RING-type domain-containing protein n=1 Tax=Caenorhabditis tropicalis TaxID=1561998 RepID=A0A1I7UIW0_9PELO
MKSLNSHIEWVSSQPKIASNWTPNLPNFPQFSQCFLIEYKKTMKSESPEICESLVKKSEEEEELQDRECLICTDDIGRSFENTVKCDDCKRRYHDDCLSEWLKIKRTCPACSRLVLNRNEFPPLTK